MKKTCVVSAMCALAVLAFAPGAFANMGPNHWVVLPEVIWAAATGGGTWQTAVQVTAKETSTQITVNFFYQNSNSWRFVTVTTIAAAHETVRWANFLQTLGTIDTSFTYYGRVGTILIYGQDDSHPIWAHALTTNGNYGKTYPSFVWTDTGNSVGAGRNGVIHGIQNNATYRTGTGFWNSSDYATRVVRFYVMSYTGFFYIGTYFEKTFQPNGFIAFNPFAEAGLSATNVYWSWLYVVQMSITGTEGKGLFCFGSLANNTSNDTFALIAQPFQ